MGGFTLEIGSLEEPCLPYYAVLMIVIVQSRNMTGSRGPSRLSDRLFVAAFFSHKNIWALVCVCLEGQRIVGEFQAKTYRRIMYHVGLGRRFDFAEGSAKKEAKEGRKGKKHRVRTPFFFLCSHRASPRKGETMKRWISIPSSCCLIPKQMTTFYKDKTFPTGFNKDKDEELNGQVISIIKNHTS